MVKNRTLPGRRVVTIGTGLGELGRPVIRIRRRGVIINMAGNAFLGFALIDPILMAVGARKRCVPTS